VLALDTDAEDEVDEPELELEPILEVEVPLPDMAVIIMLIVDWLGIITMDIYQSKLDAKRSEDNYSRLRHVPICCRSYS
jgi:hypothetical protein